MANYFETLNSIDVSDKIEKKNGLSYLSWAWAWGELKKRFPDSIYTVYENEHGWNYHTDGHTAWVKTGVTVNGIEHIEYLPIMDHRNNSITLDKINSFDVNKAIQRSLTKAVARHGLGLYIYAGEDIPEGAEATPEPKKATPKKAAPKAQQPTPAEFPERIELREFIRQHSLDGAKIAAACKLGPNSTQDDFKAALAYAKKEREEQARAIYAQQLAEGAGNDTQG